MRQCVTLLCSYAVPLDGFGIVFGHALAFVVHDAQTDLPQGIPLLSSQGKNRSTTQRRRFRVIGMPPFTLRVVRGIISALPLASARQRRHRVASAIFASIHAKPSPMHLCAPPPNGKYANGGSSLRNSSVQRSGRNSSGSSNQRGSRCAISGETITATPGGTW